MSPPLELGEGKDMMKRGVSAFLLEMMVGQFLLPKIKN
jgi:hypothetical protein